VWCLSNWKTSGNSQCPRCKNPWKAKDIPTPKRKIKAEPHPAEEEEEEPEEEEEEEEEVNVKEEMMRQQSDFIDILN
jgi:hypothetical protein